MLRHYAAGLCALMMPSEVITDRSNTTRDVTKRDTRQVQAGWASAERQTHIPHERRRKRSCSALYLFLNRPGEA